ncbi:hypothetical protein COP1_024027 [Malus domestica]|uniref:Uncharacterized protein n=1 Tax=Malus domestica TaxID=3750 RepID=A0A498HD23_MALDO|nr:hypothetical protein DVH24_028331 [Malus domestica]
MPPWTRSYPRVNYAMEGRIPTNAVDFPGTVGRSISTIREVDVSRAQLQDSHGGGSEHSVEIGGSDHLNAAQNTLRAFLASADQNVSSLSGSYRYVNAPQVSYHEMNPQPSAYQINPQHGPYKLNPQHSPYRINP